MVVESHVDELTGLNSSEGKVVASTASTAKLLCCLRVRGMTSVGTWVAERHPGGLALICFLSCHSISLDN